MDGRYGRSNVRNMSGATEVKPDVHTRLMQRYPKVPWWWFLILLLVNIAVCIAFLELNTYFQLPWWGLLLSAALSLFFTLPIGIVTRHHQSAAGAQYNNGDDLGIPPRAMFVVQVFATLLAGLVNLGTSWWLYDTVENGLICKLLLRLLWREVSGGDEEGVVAAEFAGGDGAVTAVGSVGGDNVVAAVEWAGGDEQSRQQDGQVATGQSRRLKTAAATAHSRRREGQVAMMQSRRQEVQAATWQSRR
ncbi:unnamed protein product [Closterium sp. Naga37s-1]|nr:unnamed protein product [Closterium sp. Naga37s-1]